MAARPIPPPKPHAVADNKSRSQAGAKLSAAQAREENAYTLGVQAYLWGFPLAEYGRTLPQAVKVGGAGWNAFRKFTALKTAKDQFVVTPNNVTIDAYCVFDVSEDPVAMFVPKVTQGRWYIVQLADHFDEIEIGRCSIGSTTDGLKEKNDDGSLTLYLQKNKPAPDKAPNWLPAPAGAFNVTMRFCGPETSVLDGSYRLPAVKRVN